MKINDIDEMKLWNGLPALYVGEYNYKKKWAIFSNINSKITIAEFNEDELENPNTYEIVKNSGMFDCLKYKNQEICYDIMTVVLSLTENCNCRCRYCFLDAGYKGKTMPIDLMHSGINKGIELANGRTLVVAAFGGEPGINLELLREMVRYTKEKCKEANIPCKFAITTNGIISDEVINLIIHNEFEITLSMDGIEKVQNFQRPLVNGNESYSCVINTIKKLVKANRNNIKVRSTITKFSVSSMPEQVKLLASLGLHRLHFGIVVPSGRGKTSDEKLTNPSAEEFIKYLKQSIDIGKQLKVNIIAFPYMGINLAPMQYCDGNLHNKIVVSPTGAVSSCLEVQSENHELFNYLGLGNYDENTKQLDLNNCCKNKKVKRNIKNIVFNSVNCEECPLNFYCGKGCPNQNYRTTGDINTISKYSCQITREILPAVLRMFYEQTYTNNKGGEIYD